MLGTLRRGGWVTSVVRGMTERRQHRWFLTRRAVDLLYVTGHQHPEPREEARATGLAAFHPEGQLPEDYRERFALDHDHPAHLEGQGDSPFALAGSVDDSGAVNASDHEHPPWTATSRGLETSLRRLAMLEPVYRLAPDLLRSGRVRPPAEVAASREVRMTDFRLLRHGGFYHDVPGLIAEHSVQVVEVSGGHGYSSSHGLSTLTLLTPRPQPPPWASNSPPGAR